MTLAVENEFEGLKSHITRLPANLLRIDPSVQRAASATRVAKLAKEFRESAVGVLTVSQRSNLIYVVLDGQTRLLALRKFANDDDTTLELTAQVYTNLSRVEEAQIFLAHNDRSKVNPLDKFKIALVAGEEWAHRVNDTAARHGFEVSVNCTRNRRFTAVTMLDEMLRREGGQDAVERAFEMAHRAWGYQESTASVEAIGGLSLFFLRHTEQADVVKLAAHLTRSGTPKAFVGAVRARQGVLGVRKTEAAYQELLVIYNKGLKSGRLEQNR